MKLKMQATGRSARMVWDCSQVDSPRNTSMTFQDLHKLLGEEEGQRGQRERETTRKAWPRRSQRDDTVEMHQLLRGSQAHGKLVGCSLLVASIGVEWWWWLRLASTGAEWWLWLRVASIGVEGWIQVVHNETE